MINGAIEQSSKGSVVRSQGGHIEHLFSIISISIRCLVPGLQRPKTARQYNSRKREKLENVNCYVTSVTFGCLNFTIIIFIH